MSLRRSKITRRDVLKSGAALAGAACLPRWFVEENRALAAPETSKSPNERIGILLVGCGGMGNGDARLAQQFGDIVAVCDADANRAGKTAEALKAKAKYSDFRKAIADKNVDVVINATPDHWHTLINIHALRAGKDVYSEKPLTLTIDEGKRLVEVVRQTKGVLQTGSQQRSNNPQFRLACELVRNGRIGKLQHIITTLPSGPIDGPFDPKPVPEGLDWDLWQGQAPEVEYRPERCHTFFRFWLDYSGGTMTDWGAHHNDIAQWGNDTERSGPVTVEGKVLVPPVPGGYTAYGKYSVEYTYANGVRMTCKSVPRESFYGVPTGEKPVSDDERNGVRFIGTDGWIFVNREKITASDPDIIEQELPSNAVRLATTKDHGKNNHMGNFFDCVRSREAPICDVEIGHRSVSVCHLGVIALRTGRKLQWDPEKEEFVGDADANSYLAREMRSPWGYDAV